MLGNETTRQQKISRLLQKDLGEIFREEGRSHYHGVLISVTKVYISRDLGLARVYLSLFGKDREKIFENIEGRAHEFRGRLGNLVRHQLRVVPNLEFFFDDSLDYVENIERLLKN
jgi:ribosome-binding factor A